jgi:hypothetical protein
MGKSQALTSCGKCETGLNILGGQIWEIVQDFSDAHAATEVIENVGHRDSGATNAGFAAANSWINADVLEVVHGIMVAQKCVTRFCSSFPRDSPQPSPRVILHP